MTNDEQDTAARFLRDHEILKSDLADARRGQQELTDQVVELSNVVRIQQQIMERTAKDRDRYLRYAVELAAQLQFMVSGSERALRIAQRISGAVSEAAGAGEDVSGADMERLKSVLGRLGYDTAPPPVYPPLDDAEIIPIMGQANMEVCSTGANLGRSTADKFFGPGSLRC